MQEFKRELVLHDKNGRRNELTITNERGYFSICNDHGQNEFEPKNNLQQQLLDIWHTYHLNGMSSGTKEQDEALEKVGLKSANVFDKACEHLKSIGLYEVDYKGEKYRYGSGWIYKDMPDNFQETLFSLLDALQEQEDEYNDRLITIDDLNKEEFIDHADNNGYGEIEKLMAACLECGVSWSGLENVTTSNGENWEIEGQDYCIYTDEEADEAHLKDVESFVDDIGFDGFNKQYIGGPYVTRLQNGNIEVSMSIEIGSNERGNSLAHYDGKERYQEVNGTYYYLYKC